MEVSGLGSLSGSPSSGREASSAEREASKRIEAAGRSVRQAEEKAEESIEVIRTNLERQLATEKDRQSNALERQRVKGYEDLRTLQRQQQSELQRIKKDFDREITDVQDHDKWALHHQEKDGKERLTSAITQNNYEIEFQNRASKEEKELLTERQIHDIRLQLSAAEAQREALHSSNEKEMKNLYENSVLQRQRAANRLDESYQSLVKGHEVEQQEMRSAARTKLDQLQKQNQVKLAHYAQKQVDPFYQAKDLGAQLRDRGEFYEVELTVPKHEQENISCSIKGNSILVSGNRRNEEKRDLGAGHTLGTSTFQSFHETFPLRAPVENEKLKKEFRGEKVLITVPKKDLRLEHEVDSKMNQVAPPPKVRVELPYVLENLEFGEGLNEESGKGPGGAPLA